MSSVKQIEANRRNALKSTGPTTPEGKRRSRGNAMRHGLTAETVIALLEDLEDYQAFEAAVISDYDAETVVERELVLRLASVLWRLRRATSIESALFESVIEDSSQTDARPSDVFSAGLINASESHKLLFQSPQRQGASLANDATTNEKRNIAECFLRLAGLSTFALDRLSRYEHLLWRQSRQIVFTLESLRRRKQAPRRSSFPFSSPRREPGGFPKEFR